MADKKSPFKQAQASAPDAIVIISDISETSIDTEVDTDDRDRALWNACLNAVEDYIKAHHPRHAQEAINALRKGG
jgi:phosphatidate phosphatase APP1